MPRCVIPFTAGALLATLVLPPSVTAQIAIPVKSFDALTVEIHSLRDDITLFQGDPQQLLLMNVRPNRFKPRVEYTGQADATLRIRDLYAVDHPDFASATPEDRDKSGDPPLEETWEIRLSPVAPTRFTIQTERGKSSLDFSGMEVRGVALRADETQTEVEFSDPNPIELERFAARIIAGSLQFQHVLNTRAKEISLDLPDAECRLEINGKEFQGEMAVNCLGVPGTMQLIVPRKIGLRVTGPAATLARFEAPHMSPAGEELMSHGYAEAKCRVHLTLGSEMPKLEVQWE